MFFLNRYTLTTLPEPPIPEPPSGVRKRKQQHHVVSPISASVKLSPTNEHLYGKLNPRELIQKLNAVGIKDAELGETSPGSYVIHLVINYLNNPYVVGSQSVVQLGGLVTVSPTKV